MVSIIIGVTCPHTVPAQFLMPLFNVINYSNKKIGETTLIVSNHPFVHESRNICVNEFLKTKADYLFFLDADVLVNPNIIELLLKNEKSVVSGPVHYKKSPYPPLAYSKTENSFTLDLQVTEKKLYSVDAVGAGCLLIQRKVLEKMDPRWFDIYSNGQGVGEDLYFCQKVKDLGFEMYYDNTIAGVKHLGAAVDSTDFDVWNEQIKRGKAEFFVKK